MPLGAGGPLSSHWRSIVAAPRYGTGLARTGGRDLSAQADFVRDSGRTLLSHERHPLHTANGVPWRHQSDYTAYWLSSDSNCGRWIPPLR